MSEWQKILKDDAVASLDKLAEKFGHDVIDVEALRPAFENFQMRITPAALEHIKEVGDPMWNQYVPTTQELDIVDGVIDSLDEDADSPVPNITHRYPDRVLFLVSPVCASYCRFCTRRRKVGDPEKIPLGCQTVLLRGVNDDPKTMMELMHALLKARVRPYYIYMADQVAGGEHFRTTVQKGLEIVKALRGWTSGLAVPHFVIDAPGGGGKVPLLPEYVEEINEDEVVFRNYEGKRFVYKQPRQPATTSCDTDDIVPIRVASRSAAKKAVRQKRRKTGS